MTVELGGEAILPWRMIFQWRQNDCAHRQHAEAALPGAKVVQEGFDTAPLVQHLAECGRPRAAR
jgi:hypothetical protein